MRTRYTSEHVPGYTLDWRIEKGASVLSTKGPEAFWLHRLSAKHKIELTRYAMYHFRCY